MFTAQGPYKCCVLEGSPRCRGGTAMQFGLYIEGSPRYRGSTGVQFAQVQLVYIIVDGRIQGGGGVLGVTL